MTPHEKAKAEDKLVGRVVKLMDLMDYQNGSVVSRTILDQASGTVTLFAFDEGQGLSEHTAPFDALVSVLDGKAGVTISGKPFDLTAGDTIIMPAGQPHSLHAASRFKMVLVMIRT